MTSGAGHHAIPGLLETEGRGKNLVHALKFVKYVMGFDLDLDSILGPNITGR